MKSSLSIGRPRVSTLMLFVALLGLAAGLFRAEMDKLRLRAELASSPLPNMKPSPTGPAEVSTRGGQRGQRMLIGQLESRIGELEEALFRKSREEDAAAEAKDDNKD